LKLSNNLWEISQTVLKKLLPIHCALISVVEVEKGIYSLELFHGPTMAFKGRRSQFSCLVVWPTSIKTKDSKNTVLVATSGDSGGAVLGSFLGVAG
jgi:threonine synthase